MQTACQTCLVSAPYNSLPASLEGGLYAFVIKEVRLDDADELDLRRAGRERERAERTFKVVKAGFYAVQVFYSFFIM